MRSKPTFLVAALLGTSALGYVALDIGANYAARSGVTRLVAGHRGVRVAGVSTSALDGRVTLSGLAADIGSMHISIETLTFPIVMPSLGFVGSATASPFEDKTVEAPASQPTTLSPFPSAASMGNASATNVVITSGTTTYRIKRVDLTGTMLSDSAVAELLDTKATEALPIRLKKLSAAAIVVPEILADDNTAGSERHWIVKQVLLANVVAGKVANGSAAGMTFSMKDGNGAVNGALGSITTAGLDVAQVAHVFESLRTDDAEPILPLYEMVNVDTIKVTNVTRNATISIASLRESGAKGRALKTDLQTSSAAAAQATGPDGKTDPKSAAFFDDMVHSFTVEAIEAADLSADNDDPAGKSTFGATRIAMHGFGGGYIGDLGLSDFHFAGPDGKIALGATTFSGLAVPRAQKDGSTKVPPFSGKMAADKLVVDITTHDQPRPDEPTTPTTPTTPIKFQVDHFDFASDATEPGSIPPKSTMSLKHLGFDLSSGTESTKALYDMGYRHIDLSSDLVAAYDPGTQTLDIGSFKLDGAGMGTLGLGLTLVNVSNGLVSSNPEIAKASAFAMLIKHLDIDVKNAGLFEKAIAWKAKTDGTTVPALRDTGVDFFANALPNSLGGAPNAKLVGTAIAKFIADPKTLHVSATSKNGVGAPDMELLATPDVLLNSLDMKASANQ